MGNSIKPSIAIVCLMLFGVDWRGIVWYGKVRYGCLLHPPAGRRAPGPGPAPRTAPAPASPPARGTLCPSGAPAGGYTIPHHTIPYHVTPYPTHLVLGHLPLPVPGAPPLHPPELQRVDPRLHLPQPPPQAAHLGGGWIQGATNRFAMTMTSALSSFMCQMRLSGL